MIRGVGKFFYPAVWLAEGSVGGVFRLLKMEVPEEEVATEDEIRMIVDKGSEQGLGGFRGIGLYQRSTSGSDREPCGIHLLQDGEQDRSVLGRTFEMGLVT